MPDKPRIPASGLMRATDRARSPPVWPAGSNAGIAPTRSTFSHRSLRLAALQQLRHGGDRDHFGLLAADSGQTDRAGDACELLLRKSSGQQPLPEAGPFALAADQADKGQVGMNTLAQQAGGNDVEVFGMAEAHDQHE